MEEVLKALGKRLESKKGHARLRFREQRPPQHLSASSERDTGQRLSDDEILLTVGILRYGHSNRLQELVVAGSQRMTDLRDALACPADINLRALGMAVPSAYFYIEGTFYNDLRAAGSLDYSEPIISFCQQNSLLPPAAEEADAEARQRGDADQEGSRDEAPQASYKREDMHSTRFMDLVNLRVGSFPGYVFCHQGCCEHALYFKDVRRIHPDDSHSLSDYPIPVYQAQFRRQRCSLCATRFAVKVTYEDEHAPESPAFWCIECYQAMHYDGSGKLKYQHKVFPYQVN
ncbi:hypothetical protein COCSUDRAFT_62573 [Coccomyxa subellipsoidea C-169]|uniref:snRNA-activating protein complex subunit 3 n=1 Tax=Coccomyxa subellipsoidea (strain C-169) TaxID=574566 RepID=I0Z081_COCSC|nr:hypothetical protein COCSUDRAFT_62573 [Coccomyxa subellipsoidea C-169]EIE24050.1 hypothetical protein COCSUDRAFT_62573 [Coccomyxa subellipsoidea C-169]|eukprot:XP_005648594.1 hypothetical protein COCSUDRAFT_62573 [Coccomyxa subellipsoidea C-169]